MSYQARLCYFELWRTPTELDKAIHFITQPRPLPGRLAWLILAAFLLCGSGLACTLLRATPPVTPSEAPQATENKETAPPLPTPTAQPTSTPLPPSPTLPTPTSTPVVQAPPTPTVDFTDLAPHRQAMLPGHTGEVDQVAATGASRYYLEVSLDDSGRTEQRLTGIARVRYTNTETGALPEIYFHLYPNLPGYDGRMTVETVVVDNQVIAAELEVDNTVLRVPLVTPLAPGATVDVTLFYQAIIPQEAQQGYNIFSSTGGTLALAGFYPAVAVYDQNGWSIEAPPPYGDATYLDISLYRVRLVVPDAMVVAASGSLVKQSARVDPRQVLEFASGPMRDFYLVMRPDYQVTSQTVDGTVVNSYAPPDLAEGGRLALQYAAEALRVYNNRFGQYPYAELDVAATPTRAGGVEYPGVIVVRQALYDQPGGFFEQATAHEVAHQWWYGLVGNDQVNDPWLDESLTSYSTVHYWQTVEGPEAARQVIEGYFLAPYEAARAQGQDRGVTGPVAAFSLEEYGTFVYGKGPLFFYNLQREVGDETYFKIMQTYYSQYKYKLAYPADLFAVIEQVSGRDIEPLRQEWLDN